MKTPLTLLFIILCVGFTPNIHGQCNEIDLTIATETGEWA